MDRSQHFPQPCHALQRFLSLRISRIYHETVPQGRDTSTIGEQKEVSTDILTIYSWMLASHGSKSLGSPAAGFTVSRGELM